MLKLALAAAYLAVFGIFGYAIILVLMYVFRILNKHDNTNESTKNKTKTKNGK